MENRRKLYSRAQKEKKEIKGKRKQIKKINMSNYQIPGDIRQEVLTRLEELEKKYDIYILLAIESGSRAWGFSSIDSDYDVRIIYMHKPEWYWNVKDEFVDVENKGAINLPINDDFDIAGWDLRKTLELLYKSNPPLLEWLRSPIVYRKDEKKTQELIKLSAKFYSQKSTIYHYLSMAEGNLNQYLLNKDRVKRKKYLYVIRPVLACLWIEQHASFPPMEIDQTLETIQNLPIYKNIIHLIDGKRVGTELGEDLPDKEIETFLVTEIQRLKMRANKIPKHICEMKDLNEYFRSTLISAYKKS